MEAACLCKCSNVRERNLANLDFVSSQAGGPSTQFPSSCSPKQAPGTGLNVVLRTWQSSRYSITKCTHLIFHFVPGSYPEMSLIDLSIVTATPMSSPSPTCRGKLLMGLVWKLQPTRNICAFAGCGHLQTSWRISPMLHSS